MNNKISWFIIPLVLVLIASCSGQKDNTELLSSAQKSMQQGNNSEAIINIKNILQTEPNHIEARYLLGKISLMANDFNSAEKELMRVLKLKPDHEQAILLLAKTQLLLSKYSTVIESLETAKFSDMDDQIYSLLLLGQANLSLDNIAQAKENIQEANDLSSSDQHSILGRAYVAVYENSNDKALELVDELISQNDTFPEAWLLKGSILSNQDDFKGAADAYSEYYKLVPNNFGIRTIIAQNYIRAGEYELAKEHILALEKQIKNNPTVDTLVAQVKYTEGDYEKASELAKSAVNTTNSGLAQMIYGLSNFQLKNYDAAYSSLNTISSNLPKGHTVHKVLAILQVKLGYTEELSKSLSSFSDNSEDFDIYADVAVEFMQQGNKKAAIEMFEKASVLSPDNARIKAKLGVLKLNNANTDGLSELSEALKLDPNFKAANIALVMQHLKNNDIDKATEIADAWIAATPNNSVALILRGNISVKANKNDEAISYFNQSYELDPNDITPLFNLAALYAKKEDFVKSNEYLDKLFALDLEYPFAYRLAISNSIQLKEEDKFSNKLLTFIEQSPDVVWPRIVLAKDLSAKGKHSEAIDILTEDVNYAKLPDIYFQTLSNILRKNKNLKQLNAMYKDWQFAQPFNEMAYLYAAAEKERLRDYSGALQVIQDSLLKTKLKSNFKLQALEMYYLLATNQPELANQKVQKLVKNKPNDPLLQRIQGQIAMSRFEYGKAVELLSKSYQSNKKEAVGLLLVAAYKANNNTPKAIDFLIQEKSAFGNSQAYKRALAELYIKDKPNKAISNYKEILTKAPKDVVTLNNLAWVYYEQNQFDQALTYAERAIELAPENPQVLDTYGLILLKKNDFKQAIKTLELAFSLAKKNADIKKHLAQAYRANSQPEKAEQLEIKN